MITYKIDSSRHHRRKIGAAGWIVALAILTLAALQPSAAGETRGKRVITTIIPSEVRLVNDYPQGDGILLRFSMDALPANASEGKATLRLICQDMGFGNPVSMDVFLIDGNESIDPSSKIPEFENFRFDLENPGGNKPGEWAATPIPMALKLEKDESAVRREFSLLVLSSKKEGDTARKWYPTGDESKFQPRLILEYTIPDQAAVVQADGVPATHSPRAFLPTADSKPWLRVSTQTVTTGNLWSYAPVFKNDLVYVIQTVDDGSEQLQALPPLGGKPVWPPVTLDKPGQHLLLSESGRLYIVGKEKILVYKLDANPHNPPVEVKTLKPGGQPFSPKSLPDLKPTLAPTVGPDGSLYYVNGMEVYGRNPDLQELWKVPLEDKLTSRVTVGPSGQFVYLTANNEGLVAINAQTGQKMTTTERPGTGQTKLSDPNHDTFHAPVVLRQTSGTEIIYVAVHSSESGVLKAFDNPHTQHPPARSADSAPVAEYWEKPLLGLFSQPTARASGSGGAWKIDTVQIAEAGSTLMEITWAGDKWNAVSATPGGPSFTVAINSYLQLGGNLAVDEGGHALVWNQNGAESKLYALGTVEPLSATLNVSGDALLFGTDGTLYAADPTNAEIRKLRAILPSYTMGKTPGSQISSPTHLRVGGVVDKTTTLSAGGSVLLGKGFKVKNGTTFTVRTNSLKK